MFLVRVMHVHNYSTLPFTQSGSNTDTAPAVQPFTARPGVALNLTECETPLHFFSVFMDDTAWNFLVEHTNQYAAVKLAAAPPSRRSLYSNWRDVTMDEMKAFVGVILNMGVVQYLIFETIGDRMKQSICLFSDPSSPVIAFCRYFVSCMLVTFLHQTGLAKSNLGSSSCFRSSRGHSLQANTLQWTNL